MTSSKKKSKNLSATRKTQPLKLDLKTPSMFRDESPELALSSAKKISDLKNLGPMAEVQFKQAKIKSVKEFVTLGWKGAMQKLVKANPKHRHSIYAYALIGALKNIEWNAISDQDKQEAREFVASLKKSSKS